MSFGEHMSAVLLGGIHGSEITGLQGIHMLSFARYSQTIFQSNDSDLTFPLEYLKVPVVSHPCHHLVFSVFHFSYLLGVQCFHIVVLSAFIMKFSPFLFIDPQGILFVKYLFNSFAH